MSNKSTKSVTAALSIFAAEQRLISGVKLWKIEKIKGDAGSEFNSTEFEQFCIDRYIVLSLASPKHQEGNHFAERTWQSLRKLAQSTLVHARLPDMYMYHALLHAWHVFNPLSLKDLVTSDGIITTLMSYLWDLNPMLVILESLDVHVLLRSGQSQWMANLRTIARVHREASEKPT